MSAGDIWYCILMLVIIGCSFRGYTYLFGKYPWETWEEYQAKEKRLRKYR